jgi:hypothetical protein
MRQRSRHVAFGLSALLIIAAAGWGQKPNAGGSGSAQKPPTDRPVGAEMTHRWVYLQTNLLVDENVEKALAMCDRAAKAGYNGLVVTDSKFMRWDDLPDRYLANAKRLRDACRKLKLDFVACVFPMGYSNDLLCRDPNLAEGLPVMGAPFVVRDGRIVPDDDTITIANGGFETYNQNKPAGWGFVDRPGQISFIDTQTKTEGKASLRMQDIGAQDPQNGNSRACQKLKVQPFRYYHVSVAVKTQDFEAVRQIRIAVLGEGGASLNFFDPPVAPTQDWRRIDIAFNSLEFSEVNLYLGIWGGKGGKIWWDDVRVEPAGLVNVLRRPGAPLLVAGADGKTAYDEGKDFEAIKDPKLGMVPYAGGYSVWHEAPPVAITAGGRLKDGQKLLLNYYHPALIYDGSVMCCMNEAKVYEILKWQAAQVHKHLQPDGYFMAHDEIRTQGWDLSCMKRRMTAAEILADNVKKCTEILDREDAGKPIYDWSDMFDPYHNAGKTGRYYLVKGEGPWSTSWTGLDPKVTVVNWNSQDGLRLKSLEHFAGRGHRQILAGYYDGNPGDIVGWLKDAAKVRGVVGAMYTTWQNKYEDLEAFAKETGSARPGR